MTLAAVLLAEGLIAFCALAFEIAVARLVAPWAGMSTDTWTAIIAAFLLAWALGNGLGGRIARRGRGLLMPAALAARWALRPSPFTPAFLPAWDALILAPAPLAKWRIAAFAGAPSIAAGFCLGVTTPLLMAAIFRLAPGSGVAIGAAVAAGAGGSVLGALAASWLLLDGLGLRKTFMSIGLIALAAATLLLLAAYPRRGGETS
jgi:predicted membrane-bound spermidine synthase